MKTTAKILIAGGTMFLLTSIGGAAIMAAPILMPTLWWASKESGRWGRAGFSFLAGLVATEVGWFAAYSVTGERQPFILGVPLLCFVGTLMFFALTGRRRGVDASEVSGSASSR